MVFVARCAGDERPLRARIDRLIDFYRPLGIASAELARLPALSLVAGDVRFGGRGGKPASVTTDRAFCLWGGPAPRWLSAADALLAASDEQLRGLDRTLAAFAATGTRARLVTGCAGATALFAARSPAIEAWSSHAVAAGYLAHGSVNIDPAALPEFFAAEFVGGDRTHLAGVKAVAPATDVELTPRGASARSYWPARERFALVAEDEAAAAADAALLGSLSSRLAGAGDIELGLTAGADSRVTAVALSELGLDFRPVTFAPGPDAPDAAGAAAVAKELRAEHRVYGYELVPDADSISLIDAEARWSDGLAPLAGLGTPETGNPAVFVTGGGGETARAWYYRWQARNYANPSPRQLRRVLAHVHWRIDGAAPDAHDRLDAAIAGWVESARATGHTGWRTLDVVYESERLRRWGRARLPRTLAPLLYALSSPELTRALVSLPLEDRIADGFHRRFVAARAPALALPEPARQRPGVPVPVRRAMSALRHRRGMEESVRGPWFWRDVWRERPLNRAFIADEALSREIIRSAMGPAWVDRLRAGFLAGEDHATHAASLVTGVAALDLALASLR
jgi:hypothetical protein